MLNTFESIETAISIIEVHDVKSANLKKELEYELFLLGLVEPYDRENIARKILREIDTLNKIE